MRASKTCAKKGFSRELRGRRKAKRSQKDEFGNEATIDLPLKH